MSRQPRVAPPAVPDRLEGDGWKLVEDEVETLFSLPTARVEGHTRVYEDADLRGQVREATGVDHMWRFFFATRVSFTPSLAPGLAPMVRSTVTNEARSSFAEDLGARGFDEIRQGKTKSVDVASVRARVTPFRATFPIPVDEAGHADGAGESERSLDVRAYLAVWDEGGEFVIVGGAYPSGLTEFLGGAVETDGEGYRQELLDLIRSVAQ